MKKRGLASLIHFAAIMVDFQLVETRIQGYSLTLSASALVNHSATASAFDFDAQKVKVALWNTESKIARFFHSQSNAVFDWPPRLLGAGLEVQCHDLIDPCMQGTIVVEFCFDKPRSINQIGLADTVSFRTSIR